MGVQHLLQGLGADCQPEELVEVDQAVEATANPEEAQASMGETMETAEEAADLLDLL